MRGLSTLGLGLGGQLLNLWIRGEKAAGELRRGIREGRLFSFTCNHGERGEAEGI